MPRPLNEQAQARFLRWGQARGHLFRALGGADIPQKLLSYKQLEKRLLKEARTPAEQRELRRRITEDLLTVTSEGPWRGFSPYLRRMEKLGYSSMDCRLLVCGLAARASKGSRAGRTQTARLIEDIERRLRARSVPPELSAQIDTILSRARRLAALDGQEA